MPVALSRQKLARYYASQYQAGRDVTQQLAAYLVATKRTKEADLLVRDIEVALLDAGVIITDVTTARALGDELRTSLTEFLKREYNADKVVLRPHEDARVLGGVRIETADAQLDATLATRLAAITALKV